MTTSTYLSSYGAAMRHRSPVELMNLVWWNRAHPELRRRIFAMCDAGRDAGVDLGIGGSFRTAAQQAAMHKSQPWLSPAPGGSYHEGCPTDVGVRSLGADMLNIAPAIGWMLDNDTRFGLVDFRDYRGEKWHVQPVEIPRSRQRGRTNPYVLRIWDLPDDPAPPDLIVWAPPGSPLPLDPLRIRWLQQIINERGWGRLTVDGLYGAATTAAVRTMQQAIGAHVDGKYGPQTAATLAAWLVRAK